MDGLANKDFEFSDAFAAVSLMVEKPAKDLKLIMPIQLTEGATALFVADDKVVCTARTRIKNTTEVVQKDKKERLVAVVMFSDITKTQQQHSLSGESTTSE